MTGAICGLGAEDLFELRFLRDARMSPDGRHVAYTVSRTDHEEQHEIWIENTYGGERHQLLYPGNARAPQWSSDGRHLAFIADERVRVATYPSLAISEPLTPAHLTAQGTPSWSPGSDRVAVSLLERRQMHGAARRITTTVFKADGLGFLDSLSQHIYEIEVATGELRCLTPAARFCSQPQWSPCGRRILFFSTDDAIPFASYSQRLLAIDLETGEISEVLDQQWYVSCIRWLPAGDRFIMAAAQASDLTIPTYRRE
jgi:Tol biopolymer transport system component